MSICVVPPLLHIWNKTYFWRLAEMEGESEGEGKNAVKL